MSSNRQIEILGIPIVPLTASQLVSQVNDWIAGDSCKLIFTPNAEMCVEAQRNAPFREAFMASALNLPDSTGLVFASRLLHKIKLSRLPGTDAMELLCHEAASRGWRVYLLGGGAGIARRAAESLRSSNSNLEIRYANLPFATSANGQSSETSAVLAELSRYQPQLLFVALGAPKQELWLSQNSEALTEAGVKIAMGVGGTLDYLAGAAWRAPKVIRSLGLEWLVRLIIQPRRLRRIVRATIVFPWLVLLAKLKRTPAQ